MAAAKAKEESRFYITDDERWAAVQRRDKSADGQFFTAVRTTRIYCRPSCPARHPKRENVRFYSSRQEAEDAGFRPCKRCRPTETRPMEQWSDAVTRACRLMEQSPATPDLDALAETAGMSRFHFHRVFKSVTGLTPKAYAAAHRANRAREELANGKSVTQSLYGAGYGSSGRFYAATSKILGMTPSVYRAGGRGMAIRFATGQCSLGMIQVAATEKGVCSIMFGDDADSLQSQLAERFPKAQLSDGDEAFAELVNKVIAFVETPALGLDLPLDIRGTAFQERVWQALCEIPCGTTLSYTDLAERLGVPRAVRAVASAIAANRLAVAIPCHRVVRNDGSLAGYRWGIDRKARLIEREKDGESKSGATEK